MFKRTIYQKIVDNLPKRHIIVLVGARQVGKTTLMRMINNHIKNIYNQPTLFFDAERDNIREDFKTYESAIRFLSLKGLSPKSRCFLFIDEFQKIAGITPILKSLYDHNPNIKCIISGSSSLELRGKLDESMAGRKRVFEIFPLEFKEYLNFIQSKEQEAFIKISFHDATSSLFNYFVSEFETFVLFGGYPNIVLSPDKNEKLEELAEIYRSYIEKDIVNYLRVENTEAYNKLLSLLSIQIGSQCNINTLTKALGIARDTTQKYLYYQEKTYQIYLLKAFHSNKIKEIIKMSKVYCLDTGLRNFAIKNFNEFLLREDLGHLIENAVFLEMLKNKDILQNIYYWRTKNQTEVDFIIESNGTYFPVEVKYSKGAQIKIPSNIKTFFTHYPKSSLGFVITKNYFTKMSLENRDVFFVPAFLSSRIMKQMARENHKFEYK